MTATTAQVDLDGLRTRVRQVVEKSGLSDEEFAAAAGRASLVESLSGSRPFSSLDVALVAETGRVAAMWLITGEARENVRIIVCNLDELGYE